MASNPMQRQKRVSFLLGMLVMLIIAAIVIALLFMQLINLKKEQDAIKAAERTVYVVSEDVSSGSGIQITAIEGDTSREPNVTEDVADASVVPENIATSADFYSDEGQTQARADLVDGDFVDVRIRFGNGQDYIVVSKKQVSIPEIAGAPAEGVININLSEDESIAMSSAIIELYQLKAVEMYVSRYTDPGMQVAATPTYPVSAEALNLMDSNPNIVDEAKQAIASRYNRNLRENYINGQINSVDGDERKSNLESSVEQHITQQKELRQQYLQSLEDAAAAADAAATSTTTKTTSTGTSN